LNVCWVYMLYGYGGEKTFRIYNNCWVLFLRRVIFLPPCVCVLAGGGVSMCCYGHCVEWLPVHP
jgi:hypothetical protein